MKTEFTFEKALRNWQIGPNRLGKRDVTHTARDERRRDELCKFFEETESVLVADTDGKLVGAAIRDEARWKGLFQHDLDEAVSCDLRKRSEKISWGWKPLAAGRVVSWSVARPAEVRKFTHTLDQGAEEKFVDMLLTAVAHLTKTHPEGVDAEKSLLRTHKVEE